MNSTNHNPNSVTTGLTCVNDAMTMILKLDAVVGDGGLKNGFWINKRGRYQ